MLIFNLWKSTAPIEYSTERWRLTEMIPPTLKLKIEYKLITIVYEDFCLIIMVPTVGT